MVIDILTLNYYYISPIVRIALGLITNNVYLSFANNKINKIKEDNSKATQAALNEICLYKGGTNIIIGILSLIIQSMIVIAVLFIIAFISGEAGSKIIHIGF